MAAEEAATKTAALITANIKEELNGTPYACDLIQSLTGGTANFIYRGQLSKPLEDGTREVVIKHGEGFIASLPSFQLTTSRCVRTQHHPLQGFFLPY